MDAEWYLVRFESHHKACERTLALAITVFKSYRWSFGIRHAKLTSLIGLTPIMRPFK